MKRRYILWHILISSVTVALICGCAVTGSHFNSDANQDMSIYFDNGNGGWDEAWAVTVDASSNIYVVGYGSGLLSGSSGWDWWIHMTNPELEEDSVGWTTNFNFQDSGSDIAYDVAVDSANNVYVVGYGDNIIGGTPSSGHDWWIKKFDSMGNELDFGGSGLEPGHSGNNPCTTNTLDRAYDGFEATDVARAVAVDSNDNVYVAGYGDYLVDDSSFHDWWIKKFDSSGNEIDFGGSSLPDFRGSISPCTTNDLDRVYDGGNDDADVIADMVIDGNDNVYVIGYSDNLAGASSELDWWIKKFNSSGIEQDFGGSDYPSAGSYDSPCTTNNLDVVFDSSGGADGFCDDRAWCGTIDEGGHLYIVGEGWDLVSETSRTDWWLKKFDLDGTEELTAEKKFDSGNNEIEAALSVAADPHNNVYVAGYAYNMVSDDSSYDWWIKKFNSEGTEDTAWEKKLDGNGEDDKPHGITVDGLDYVYVVGYGSNLASGSSSYDWWLHRFSAK